VKSVTIMLLEFIPDKRTLPTITGINRYNNFEFKRRGGNQQSDITVWQSFKIGPGYNLPRNTWQGKRLLRDLKVIGTFTEGRTEDINDATHWKAVDPVQREELTHAAEHQEVDEDEECSNSADAAKKLLFPCSEAGCIRTYQSHKALTKHLENGTHKYKPEKISLRDAAIGAYKRELEGLRLPRHINSVDAALAGFAETSATAPTISKGWALRTRQVCTRFSSQQRNYLTSKFDQGARTGRKLDPKVVSKQMRNEFPKTQWLTSTQIASYWSRLAHLSRGEQGAEQSDCGEGAEAEPQQGESILNVEAIADDPYFNTVQDDIYDAIEENEADIFQ
jgi:hypothetical protein